MNGWDDFHPEIGGIQYNLPRVVYAGQIVRKLRLVLPRPRFDEAHPPCRLV